MTFRVYWRDEHYNKYLVGEFEILEDAKTKAVEVRERLMPWEGIYIFKNGVFLMKV